MNSSAEIIALLSVSGLHSEINFCCNVSESLIASKYSPSDIEITSSGKIFIGTMKNLQGNGGATILSSLTGDLDTWNINSDYKFNFRINKFSSIPYTNEEKSFILSLRENKKYKYLDEKRAKNILFNV